MMKSKPFIGNALSRPTDWLRTAPAKGVAGNVDRTAGDYGAGAIRETAVITAGEARGHDMWIDRVFLKQVRDAINQAGNGVKSRFTHPDMSGDGLGTFLGRHKAASMGHDGVVRATLHVASSAHETPDGDLAGYVMDLASEDPAAFGQSIAFMRDQEAMNEFMLANGGSDFQSPDPDNVNHYPHARLASLHAVDVVDSPAANPSGMFHAPSILADAEKTAAYALGLSDETPALVSLDVHPGRVRDFVDRFLTTHKLRLVRDDEPGSKTMSKNTLAADPVDDEIVNDPEPQPESTPEPTPEPEPQPAAEPEPTSAKMLRERFPNSMAEWREAQVEAGATLEQATAAYAVALQTRIDALEAKNRDLEKRLSAVDRGEETPLSGGVGNDQVDERTQRLQTVLGEPLGRYAASLKLNGKN